jgi:hypothetical protein
VATQPAPAMNAASRRVRIGPLRPAGRPLQPCR